MSCETDLDEKKKRELTEMMVAATDARASLAFAIYEICPSCYLRIALCAEMVHIRTVFSDIPPDRLATAALSAIQKVFSDVITLEEESLTSDGETVH